MKSEKNPVKRLLLVFVLAVVFLVTYSFIMYSVEQKYYEKLIVLHYRNRTESTRSIVNKYEKAADEIGKIFFKDLNAEVRLAVIELAPGVVNGGYSGTLMWDNAMVVRLRGGRAELPAEASGMFPDLSSEIIKNEYTQKRVTKAAGEGAPSEVILTSGRIADEWYYVQWTPVSAYNEYVTSGSSIQRLIEELAANYGSEIFIVSADEEDPADVQLSEKESGSILYGTGGMSGHDIISDLGLTGEDLKKEYFVLKTGDEEEYICTPAVLDSGRILVFCHSVKDEKAVFHGDVFTQILFAFALLAGMIIWCLSMIYMVGRTGVQDELTGRFTPEAVKKGIRKVAVLSSFLVFAVAFLTVAMQYMYQGNKEGNAVLDTLEKQIDVLDATVSELNRKESGNYEVLAQKIAGMISKDPGLAQKDQLKKIADTAMADYVILFDENGDETGCSGDYTGFSLGTDPGDPSTDFRKLLKGVSAIKHEAEKDFITGEERQTIGARYDIPGSEGKYGVLLLSYPVVSVSANDSYSDGKENIYSAFVTEDELLFKIDPESGLVESCSREEYAGADAVSLGFNEKSLIDRHMVFVRIDRQKYFGVSRLIGGKLYYYLTENAYLVKLGLLFAMVTTILFWAGFKMLAWLLLRDFTQESYEDQMTMILETSEHWGNHSGERAPSENLFIQRWIDMPPEERSKSLLQLEFAIFTAVLFLAAVMDTPNASYSALNFIIDGNWTKGLNIFGIVAVSMVFSLEYLAFLVVRVVFSLSYRLMDAKGETRARLLRNIINYGLIIFAIFKGLGFLGVDTMTLFASLGLLTLAVSLGAKDLIADILSGIGLVFDGIFTIGDYVDIGGFRGQVMEIGVRSTKFLSLENNDIKTINNHEISGVLNLSKRNSNCSVSFNVKSNAPLAEIEEMLARELPAYHDKIPGIISGPTYVGVTNVDGGKMTLTIVAEAKEDVIFSVQMGLNRMMQSLYEKKLITPLRSDTSVILRFADGDSGSLKIRQDQNDEQGS